MRRSVKAYLPRWILWVMIPLLAGIWGIITWMTFFTADGREELGLAGWLMVSVVVGAIGTMMWLMGTRRLPAYILEFDDPDEN